MEQQKDDKERFSVRISNLRKVYRIQVVITYRSDSVIRFLIYAGQTRIIHAEKWLFRKRNPWKLGKRNFNLIGTDEFKKEAARLLGEILEEIDYYLKPKPGPYVHRKNIGWKK